MRKHPCRNGGRCALVLLSDSGEQLPQVGTQLHAALTQLGVKPVTGCGCSRMIAKMNAWGVDGCREHRTEIIEHLRKAYKQTSTAELLAAAAKAVTSGLAFKLNPLDPLGSLVDLAIERAAVPPAG